MEFDTLLVTFDKESFKRGEECDILLLILKRIDTFHLKLLSSFLCFDKEKIKGKGFGYMMLLIILL